MTEISIRILKTRTLVNVDSAAVGLTIYHNKRENKLQK